MALIVPPWASIISFAIANPSPAPPCLELRELSSRKNFSKMLSRCAGDISLPVSWIESTIPLGVGFASKAIVVFSSA